MRLDLRACPVCVTHPPRPPVSPALGEMVSLHHRRTGSWSELWAVGLIIAPAPAAASSACLQTPHQQKRVLTTPGGRTILVASREGGDHWVARGRLEACLACQRLFHTESSPSW